MAPGLPEALPTSVSSVPLVLRAMWGRGSKPGPARAVVASSCGLALCSLSTSQLWCQLSLAKSHLPPAWPTCCPLPCPPVSGQLGCLQEFPMAARDDCYRLGDLKQHTQNGFYWANIKVLALLSSSFTCQDPYGHIGPPGSSPHLKSLHLITGQSSLRHVRFWGS